MSKGIPRHPAYFAVHFRVAAVTAWPEQFANVTAYATTGERWTEEQNAQANAALLQRIEALSVRHVPITGYDPATGHAEPGWDIAGPLTLGLQLGGAFRQDATFAMQDGCQSVHACGFRAHAVLGRILDRVDAE